jgi:sigma-B regulation protein RsbU (phosphoserine phosphatase)
MTLAMQSELERERHKVASLTGELLAVYEELSLLYSLGPRIGSLVDSDQIAALAVREAIEILRADCGWVVFCDGTGWHLPENCRVAIDAGTASRINQEVLGPLRFPGRSQIISHALPEEYRIDGPGVPARFLACPLPAGGNSQGCICLGRWRQAPIFTSSDQKLLYAVASLTGMTLENLRLQRSELEKHRLADELELARQIQQSLLPQDLRCVTFLDASGVSVPCYEIGGDLFDLVSLDRDLCLLAIADVSGKGPAAALQAAMVLGIMSAMARQSKEIPELMQTANRCLRERPTSNCFVTMFLATLDSRGRLRYSSAGHNPPLWIQSHGRVTELTEGAVPLGFLDSVSYPEATVQLERGDLLVFYTDGLTDSENAKGENFGVARVLDWAGRQWQQPASEVEKSLLHAVTGFCDGHRQDDDLTLLITRFLGANSSGR